MNNRMIKIAVVLIGLMLLSAVGLYNPTNASARRQSIPIVVAAAASMSDVLGSARIQFTTLYPDVDVMFNFASSGTLQRQLEAGAPVDLFISAAEAPMDRLVEKGFVQRADVTTLASNRVVLIRPRSVDSGIEDWSDLTGAGVQRIAVGNPDHVPAGQYGRAVLHSLGLWDALQSRLVPAENVRQVVSYVARGEVDAGIVYASDATVFDDVGVIAEAPFGSHPPILYPMAVPVGARQREAARLFADYLLSPPGQELFNRYGFGSHGQEQND